MKKRMARFLGAMLAVIMLAGIMAGCGTAKEIPSTEGSNVTTTATVEKTQEEVQKIPDYLNQTGFPIVKEPVEITIFGSHSSSHADWNEMIVLKKYEEMTGVKVKYNTVIANTYIEQLNIVMASGEIPDGFMRAKLSTADQVKYGSQGLLLPINKYMETYAPNFMKAVSDPKVLSAISAPDGNIYTFPQIYSGSGARHDNYKMYINKEWLDKFSLDIPQTVDEYYNALKTFKDNDANGNGKADEIGWTGDTSLKIVRFLSGSWGLNNRGFTKTDFGIGVEYDIDPKTGELRIIFLDPMYKEVLAFCNKLYTDGLIDPEIFTITSQAANNPAKAAAGVMGSCLSNRNTDLGIDLADKYVCTPALKGPYGDQIYVNVNAPAAVGMGAVGGKTKYPEAVMRWFDYFYSEEGAAFIKLGFKDETYVELPDGRLDASEAVKKGELKMTNYTPASSGQFPYSMFDKLDVFREDYISAMSMLDKYAPEEVWSPFLFTVEEQNILNSIQTDILKYREEMLSKFIKGDEPLSNWDKYIEQMKKLGSDELYEIYRAAYERTIK